ncbi:MAG: uroporphyrinogen-III C-methyltransferase [Gammaproteobacteria bacterium]
MSKDSDNTSDTKPKQDDTGDAVQSAKTAAKTAAKTDKSDKTGETAETGKPAKAGSTAKVLDELASKNKPKAGGKTRRASSSKSQAPLVLLIIVLLPILAVALFVAYQQFLMRDTVVQLQQANQNLTTTLQNQTVTLSELEQQLAQQMATPPQVDTGPLRETEAALRSEIQRLEQQLSRVESQQVSANATPDFGWKLEEAEYLVTLASQKLQLEADISGAISLLQSADVALTESEQPGIFNARQAIADDLTSLQALTPMDRDGLYLRLNALSNSAANINLLTSMRQSFENRRNVESTPLAVTDTENSVVDATLEFLSEVFIWREWDERPEAMLASGQEAVIKQNLSLHFKQAQLALLDRNSALYERSLQDARALLERYAVTNSAAGQAVLSELDAVQGIDIDPPLPTLEQSIATVRQLTDSER